jgi:hypothetical protein
MIRTPLLLVPLLVLLAVADPGRALADEPTTTSEASNAFVVPMTPTTTAETVISQIVEAGREQLAAACVANPGASVRILNPLASGDHADVACSTILDGGESVGQSSEALTSGRENVGQAQQKLTPIGIGCSIVMLGLGIFMNHAICQYPGAENPNACGWLSEAGMGGLGLACAFI